MIKKCYSCEKTKTINEFSIQKNTTGKRFSDCKACRAEKSKRWRLKNVERTKDIQRKYRKSNPEKMALKNRTMALKRFYGLTVEEYNARLDSQSGACAICGTDTPQGRGRFHVDHDHKTNQVRGLLCHRCNAGMGHFADNPELMIKAVDYLRSWMMEQ